MSLAKRYKAKQNYGLQPQEDSKHALADIRWQRIVHNDLENIPMGLIIAWCSLMSAYSSQLHILCMFIFMISRALHTVSYAWEMQPHRAIFWFVALLAVFIMATNGTVGAFLN